MPCLVVGAAIGHYKALARVGLSRNHIVLWVQSNPISIWDGGSVSPRLPHLQSESKGGLVSFLCKDAVVFDYAEYVNPKNLWNLILFMFPEEVLKMYLRGDTSIPRNDLRDIRIRCEFWKSLRFKTCRNPVIANHDVKSGSRTNVQESETVATEAQNTSDIHLENYIGSRKYENAGAFFADRRFDLFKGSLCALVRGHCCYRCCLRRNQRIVGLFFKNRESLCTGFLRIFGLRIHDVGLGMNVASGLPKQDSLPSHRPNLQHSHESQDSCKPFEFPLYSEILAALLASLIACWGGWLWGGGHRIWGGLLAVLGLGLAASVLTTVGFCNPLFWRAEWRSLTFQEANRCQYAEHSNYCQTFQHDGENVSQISVLETGNGGRIAGMKNLKLFFTSMFSEWGSGLSGPASVPFAILALFAPSAVQKAAYGALAVFLGLFSAYRIWLKEHTELEKEKAKNLKPLLDGEIVGAYIGSAITESKHLLDKSCVVLFFLKTWNKVQMPEIGVLRYELKLGVNTPTGEQIFTGIRSRGVITLIRSAQEGAMGFDIQDTGVRPQLYLRPQNSHIGFFVRGLSSETMKFSSVEITLIDALGGRNIVSAKDMPCKPHLQGLMYDE